MRKRRMRSIVGTVTGSIAAIVLLIFAFVAVLLVTEYRPEEVERVSVSGNYSQELTVGESVLVLTWNVGFGALGDNADFFMDGGKSVQPSTKERVNQNMEDIVDTVVSIKPDIMLFQEVDTDSKRSYSMDERQTISEAFPGYQETYALNFKCLFVPYPLPPIGKVSSGIMTLCDFEVSSAERIQLPCPFAWPVSTCNLKRCLLVERVPIKNSEKELVIVNLHLEAYDDGEGKAKQTAILKELLEHEAAAGNYVIAGGDFNQTFSNTDISAYPVISDEMWAAGLIEEDMFADTLQFVADNRTPTCRALNTPYEGADKNTFQYYMLDGFIVSTNLTVDYVETIDKEFVSTDHNPVLLSVTLQPEE